MKFITRELYNSIQAEPDSKEAEEASARWTEASEAYHAHHASIRDKLSPGMRAFADTTLHDGVVRSVTRPAPSELVLEVDATRNPWGQRGVFRVRFTGVRDLAGVENLVGDWWLYEEVHLHPDARFDFRVLFCRSDFRIVADEVEVQEVPSAPCPTAG